MESMILQSDLVEQNVYIEIRFLLTIDDVVVVVVVIVVALLIFVCFFLSFFFNLGFGLSLLCCFQNCDFYL